MPLSPVEQIKSRVDIAELLGGYLKLQKAGVNLKARCPFHNEKTPSFFVSPTRQSWHCFGCNKGGDIFSFLQEIEGITFPEALKILAQRAGVELRHEPKEQRDAKTKLFEANDLAAQFFATQLEKSSAGERAQAYLTDRGLHKEIIATFRLGWAPEQPDALSSFLRSRGFGQGEIEAAGLSFGDKGSGTRDRFRGRITFPLFDRSGRIVGFTGRIFGRDEGEYDPKYMNSPETPIFEKSRILYGLHAARRTIRKEGKAIFVEGQMDCLMAHQAGTENVVATSGTALTPQHLELLKRLTDIIVFAYDADLAGREAVKRGIDLALEAGLSVRIAIVPQGKDPAELIKNDAAAWTTLLAKETKPIIAFLLEQALAVPNATTVEGKRAVAGAILPFLMRMTNSIEQGKWMDELRSRLGFSQKGAESFFVEELAKLKIGKPMAPQATPTQEGEKKTFTRRHLLEEHLLALTLLHGALPDEHSDALFAAAPHRDLYRTVLAAASPGTPPSERFQTFHASVGDEHRASAERIVFTAETFVDVVRNLDVEMRSCIHEILAMDLRERLDALSVELEAAERAGDAPRVRELTEQFKTYSANLSSLFQVAPVSHIETT